MKACPLAVVGFAVALLELVFGWIWFGGFALVRVSLLSVSFVEFRAAIGGHEFSLNIGVLEMTI